MGNEINTSEGYICLFRKFLKWEWYDDANTMRVFLHCLLSANHADNRWHGIVVEQGSFVTSIGKLANSLNLTIQQVRTSLNKLKLTNEITSKGTSSYTIISIKNWALYQTNNKQDNKRVTNEQQTNNKQVTTNNNDNNDNNENNENIFIKQKTQENKSKKLDPFIDNPIVDKFKTESEKRFGRRVFLSAQQKQKIMELNADIEDFKETIPIAIDKLLNVNFDFPNFTPTVNWLLKNDNYTSVLNGTFDKKPDAIEEYRQELIKKGISVR